MRKQADKFEFRVYSHQVVWTIEVMDISIEICVTLASQDAAELWQISLTNLSDNTRQLSLYPYFSIGYMSWMNQGADFDSALDAIIASSVTPYQKSSNTTNKINLKTAPHSSPIPVPIAGPPTQIALRV